MSVLRTVGGAAVVLAVLAGCTKKSDDPSVRQRLVGRWDTDFTAFDRDTNFVLEEREKGYYPPSSHFYYTFSDTGTVAVGDSGSITPTQYLWTVSTNGSSLRLIPTQDTARPLYYRIYSLTDKSLVLEDTAASGVLSWLGMVK